MVLACLGQLAVLTVLTVLTLLCTRASGTKQVPLASRPMTLLSMSNSSVIATADEHLYLDRSGFQDSSVVKKGS